MLILYHLTLILILLLLIMTHHLVKVIDVLYLLNHFTLIILTLKIIVRIVLNLLLLLLGFLRAACFGLVLDHALNERLLVCSELVWVLLVQC